MFTKEWMTRSKERIMPLTLNFITLDSGERNSTARRPVTGRCKRVTNDVEVSCMLVYMTDSYHFAC